MLPSHALYFSNIKMHRLSTDCNVFLAHLCNSRPTATGKNNELACHQRCCGFTNLQGVENEE